MGCSKALLFGFFLIQFSQAVFSQASISGVVQGSDNEGLPHANVLVLDQKDSSLVVGGITNVDGAFSLDYTAVKPVFLAIRFVGVNEYTRFLPQKHPDLNLGTIVMETSQMAIDEVMVSAKRPLFEQKIDRTVINVQSSVTNAGNTALNVLSKSPTVSVNRANGVISLQGKQGVLVMINEKEVRMDPADLLSLLDGMPAENIKDIELITRPPAKYDAQGSAGIININMLESTTDGTVGRASINAGYGENPKYGGTVNLNLKKGKLEAYTQLSANVNNDLQIITLNTDYDFPQERVASKMYSARDARTALYSGEVGVNYALSANTDIGMMLNFYNRDYTMDATSDTDINSELNGVYNQFVQSDETNNLYRTLYNVNLQHIFGKGVIMNLDYDFINFHRDNPTSYEVTDTDGVTNEQTTGKFRSSAKIPLDIHVAKSDFEVKVSEALSFETGIKASVSGFENEVGVANWDGNTYIDDPDFTQLYLMDENIYAGYSSFDWQVSSALTLKGGLRYEYYDMNLSSSAKGVVIDKQDSDLFTSLYANYESSAHEQWGFSFVQRIQRPGFMQLAPYFYFFNKSTLFTGNPNLTPSKASQFQISYRYKTWSLSAEYTFTDNPIYSWQPAADFDRQLVVLAPSQGQKGNLYSISAYKPLNITSKWQSNYHLMLYYRYQVPIIDGQAVTNQSADMVFNMNHVYAIAKAWNVELNARYKSPHYEGVAEIAANASVDVGVQHKFKNGAALTFNVTDVFDTGSEFPVRGDRADQGMYYDFKYNVDGPVFGVNLSIPLGNKSVDARQKRQSGSSEEQQRLQ